MPPKHHVKRRCHGNSTMNTGTHTDARSRTKHPKLGNRNKNNEQREAAAVSLS
jgi:hypothetical protein